MIVTQWWNDDRGRRQRAIVPATTIESTLQAISAFWRDPYTNLGFLRALNHNKSHRGARLPTCEPKPDSGTLSPPHPT